MSLFAFVAMALAALGVYGVTAYSSGNVNASSESVWLSERVTRPMSRTVRAMLPSDTARTAHMVIFRPASNSLT